MMNYVLFFAVILISNIIHGITGFAGTLLAMPFGLMLVGYPVAKPILNVLAILSGFYVLLGKGNKVDWKELKKVILIMAPGMLGGILIRDLFAGSDKILYTLLGIFVIFMAVQGVYKLTIGEKKAKKEESDEVSPFVYAILVVAGIVHGLFVSGGPLLVGYMTKKIKDKMTFRATIATVWIFLNSINLIDDIRSGLWTMDLIKTQIISVPFLFAGMYIGGVLYKRMSQRLFMMITYVLLFISGVSLLV